MKKLIFLTLIFCSISFTDNYDYIDLFYKKAHTHSIDSSKLIENLVFNKGTKIDFQDTDIVNITENILEINKESSEYLIKFLENKDEEYLKKALNNDPKNILAFIEYIFKFDKVYALSETVDFYKKITKEDDFIDFIFIYYLRKGLTDDDIRYYFPYKKKYIDACITSDLIGVLENQTNLPKSFVMFLNDRLINSIYADIRQNRDDKVHYKIKDLMKIVYLIERNDQDTFVLYEKMIFLSFYLNNLAEDNKEYIKTSNIFNDFIIKFKDENSLNILKKDIKIYKKDFINN